ncbi:hypothetical protein B0T19DRAFT_287098 [Cercophora scortea]|uniref:PDZ domain-containing protein n=1 Tax=Cercophora scortea TaxID=314031 RepID=A0AAE0I2W7_9PEZI|nr:hypothetical protein B0T19DRAFT_287098 [Cercophora scortea]
MDRSSVPSSTTADPVEQADKARMRSIVTVIAHTPFGFNRTDDAELGFTTGFFTAPTTICTVAHGIGEAPLSIVVKNSEGVETLVRRRDAHPISDFELLRLSDDDKSADYFELADEKAQQGTSARIYGVNAGHKSITQVVVAQTDCNPPDYGKWMNRNRTYLGCHGNLSGGSSGSPAVTDNGVVAIQTATRRDSGMAFLLSASEIRDYDPAMPVGDLGVRWELQDSAPHFLRIHGPQLLPPSSEFPKVLVAEKVTGASELEEGDVLSQINKTPIHNFDELNRAIARHVGQQVQLDIYRVGKPQTVNVHVFDLRDQVPLGLIHIEGLFTVNTLGISLLSWGSREPGGLAVTGCSDEYEDLRGHVITQVNGKPMNSLADFEEQLSNRRLQLQLEPIATGNALPGHMVIDLGPQRTIWIGRRMETGFWDYKPRRLSWKTSPFPVLEMPKPSRLHPGEAQLLRVTCFPPSTVNFDGQTTGDAVIVMPGIVAVRGNTAPYRGWRAVLKTESGSVDARVKAVRHMNGISFLEYSKDAIPHATVLAPGALGSGSLWHWACSKGISIPIRMPTRIGLINCVPALMRPYRPTLANIIGYKVDGLDDDDRGRFSGYITNLWRTKTTAVALGGDYILASDIVRMLDDDARQPFVRFDNITRHDACLPSKYKPFSRDLFVRVQAAGPESKLKPDDIVIAIDGKPPGIGLSCFYFNKKSLSVTIVRDGTEHTVDEPTYGHDFFERDWLVSFQGMAIEPLPKILQLQMHRLEGLYISRVREGSPAERWGIPVPGFLLSINNQPVTGLDDLNQAIRQVSGSKYLPESESTRCVIK